MCVKVYCVLHTVVILIESLSILIYVFSYCRKSEIKLGEACWSKLEVRKNETSYDRHSSRIGYATLLCQNLMILRNVNLHVNTLLEKFRYHVIIKSYKTRDKATYYYSNYLGYFSK